MMFCQLKRCFQLILGLALVLGLSACGDVADMTYSSQSSQESSNASVNTASVAVLLTDAPSDEFSEINITVRQIELLGVDGSKVSLFSGLRTVNLLSLRNYSNLFSLSSDVPAGLYSKIRMHLDDVELVRRDDAGEIIETIHPKLVANGKLDLNPRTEFAIGPGKSMVLQLDVDAKKSVHLVKAGGNKKSDVNPGKGKKGKDCKEPAEEKNYIFRPVVFIDVVDMLSYGGKLVRVEGDVTNIDVDGKRVELCNVKGFDSCIPIQLGSLTTVYDADGGLASLGDFYQPERGVAVGRMHMVSGKGELKAEVVELGKLRDFWHVKGDVISPMDSSNEFYFDIHVGQGFIAGTTFRVSPAENAKLFSSDGRLLDWSAIAVGRVVEVEGVLIRTFPMPFTFKATTVYLDMSQAAVTQLSGFINNVDVASLSFNITTTDLGDRCVIAAEQTNVFLMSNSEGGYSGKRISFDQIADGQNVDVYGSLDSGGCYIAKDILVTEP